MAEERRKTLRLSPKDTDLAARLLREGELVGLPTETVYGLGANGLDERAVTRIFEAKGRPQDNPLILHIPDRNWLLRCCREVPETAWRLAERFWPGPLTMVLKRAPAVPGVVTAGLDTVGVRCPAHPLCREVIEKAGVPVAAPSGNLSGRPSPTTAAHMLEDMEGRVAAVLDGGPCTVGVESTIVDLTVTPPRLLRPGGVTPEALKTVLKRLEIDQGVTRELSEGEQPRAPGMKYRHYAPNAPVTVVRGSPADTAAYILEHLEKEDGILCFDEYASLFEGYTVYPMGSEEDSGEQARRLFDALRAFDATGAGRIWAQSPEECGLGLAVTNRLNKAAGFHVIRLQGK